MVELRKSGMRSVWDFRREIEAYLLRAPEKHQDERCPVCDQGFLINAQIIDTQEPVVFCEECDSLWSLGETIDESHAGCFETFVNAAGKVGLDWTELRIA